MTEAAYGLVGVLIGSGISWLQNYRTSSKDNKAKARYLAIRVVCVLDKYIEDCVSTAKDDGLSYGSRTKEGYLSPQVASPHAPIYPDDVDWKSINHDLMYQLLSFPVDVEAADRSISFIWDEIATPPDFDEGFEERAFYYSQFGLRAYNLAKQLRLKYGILDKNYEDWNPITELEQELAKITARRQKRQDDANKFYKKAS